MRTFLLGPASTNQAFWTHFGEMLGSLETDARVGPDDHNGATGKIGIHGRLVLFERHIERNYEGL